MKIFYIVTNPISPVIESQVIERVISLQKTTGFDVQVLFLLQSQHYIAYLKGKNQQSELLKEINVKFFPTVGRESKFGSIWMMMILVSQIFKYKDDKVILHCRGLGAMASALLTKSFFKKIRVIYDIRGDALAEKIFAKSSKSILENIQKKELHALKNSDKILAVSNKLSTTLQERYNYKFSAEVFYCVAKYEIFHFQKKYRESLRKELNLDNKIVFVYAGSLDRWHNIDKILELIKSVSLKREDIHLLLLTKDKELGSKKINQYNIEKITTLLSVKFKNISNYLSVADVSLLFRDNNPLNIVASPTKFAEYSLNGLGTIITDSIGDYSKMVNTSGYGLCLASKQDINEHTQQVCNYIDSLDIKKTELREEQGMIFKDNLSIESTINTLINVYKKL